MMRALKAAALIPAIFILLSCVHLPAISGNEKPDAEATAELNKILEEVSYPRDYELGVFDCSNQSAFLYDYLALKEYNCKIMIGWKLWWRWHSWLIAEKDGKEFWIEPTRKEIVCAHYYEWYFTAYRGSLQGIRKIAKIFNIISPSKEWEY